MAKGRFDYSEFKAYRDRFAKMTANFDEWLVSFLYSQGMRFIENAAVITPIDTGDLRAHWKLDGFSRDGEELKCWFINPMYYATFVEYGHAKPYKSGATPGSDDWVPGAFMMTITLDVIEREMPVEFEVEFAAFAKSMGVD